MIASLGEACSNVQKGRRSARMIAGNTCCTTARPLESRSTGTATRPVGSRSIGTAARPLVPPSIGTGTAIRPLVSRSIGTAHGTAPSVQVYRHCHAAPSVPVYRHRTRHLVSEHPACVCGVWMVAVSSRGMCSGARGTTSKTSS